MAGEKPAVTFGSGPAPLDKWNIIKILSFFAGFAVLFPSSALTASTDFYKDIYGHQEGENLLFYLSLAITITSPFVQVVVQAIQHKISYTSRIMVCLLFNACLAAIFPILALTLSTSVSIFAVILVCFIMGINNAVLKLSFFSLTSYYPAKYQQDIVFGKGLSPLLVVVVKMIIKRACEKFFPDDKSFAIRRATIIFFVLAALVPALCAAIYRYARKTSLFSKHFFPSFRVRKLLLAAKNTPQESPSDIHPQLAELTSNNDQEELHLVDDDGDDDNGNILNGDIESTQQRRNVGSFNDLNQGDIIPISSLTTNVAAANGEYIELTDDNNTMVNDPKSPFIDVQSSFDTKPEITEASVNKLAVLKKISLPAFVLGITMFITYSIYPTILLKSPPTINMDHEWFKLVLMFTFALSDFIVRSLDYKILTRICNVSSIDLFAYCRVVFIPIYFYSVYINTVASQVLIFTTILLGATNGLVFVIAMRNYSHLVKDHERSTAGSFMSIIVVVGVLVATLFALIVNKFAK